MPASFLIVPHRIQSNRLVLVRFRRVRRYRNAPLYVNCSEPLQVKLTTTSGLAFPWNARAVDSKPALPLQCLQYAIVPASSDWRGGDNARKTSKHDLRFHQQPPCGEKTPSCPQQSPRRHVTLPPSPPYFIPTLPP